MTQPFTETHRLVVRFKSMQAYSQLTIRGKFRTVARNPLPMDPLPMVIVFVQYNGQIFKVMSPVGNILDRL
jgi:hypothetical protein